ncbi:MAG: hypothetical protein AUJ71_02705 [Candidatus Omnitrophica bacterium CG1_02_49_16]|nr:MAG: hypothetical protein AUJ71_02705 [Candidatus Omnitrophica bacterium CG1_02_49_16]
MEVEQDEKQQELFSEFSSETKRPAHFSSLASTHKPILLNTTIEQIIFVGIVLILSGCFVFFLGVLRGKFLSMHAPAHLIQRQVASSQPAPKAMTAPLATQKIPGRSSTADAVAGSTQGATQFRSAGALYTIQIASYKKRGLAEQEALTIRRQGFYCTILEVAGYYVLCVGQYPTKDAAQKDLKTFKATIKGCYLRRQS